MKHLLLIWLFVVISISDVTAQLKICSWNISHLGKSKNNVELYFISEIIKDYDFIALQEVVSSDEGGPVAVRKIIKLLNADGNNFKYKISNPTNSSSPQSSERYAYIFRSSKIKLTQKITLLDYLTNAIEREPYIVKFIFQNVEFTAINFHALPKTKNPQSEIKYFKTLPELLNEDNLIFLADYNCRDNDNVFHPLKGKGFRFVMQSQKTTLRTKCINNDCLVSAYDYIMFNSKYWYPQNAGIIHFYKQFNHNLKLARSISDHCPVVVNLQIKK